MFGVISTAQSYSEGGCLLKGAEGCCVRRCQFAEAIEREMRRVSFQCAVQSVAARLE